MGQIPYYSLIVESASVQKTCYNAFEVMNMKTTRYYMVETEVCGTCSHYHQHFVLMKNGHFHPLWYGHCGRRGLRHPQPGDVCPHWSPALKPDEEPASKD